jgi:hypothetical protein
MVPYATTPFLSTPSITGRCGQEKPILLQRINRKLNDFSELLDWLGIA